MRRVVLFALAVLLGGCRGPSSQDADVALPGSGPASTMASESLEIALNWFPEAEHGGYYAALVHGLYGDAGLDVDILGGGPDAPVIQRVATGQVTFGVANADDVLLARAEAAPVVALMAPLQDSPRCIIVHQASGIRQLRDLRDLTLSMSARAPFSHYLRARLPLPGVEIVPYNLARFLIDDDYAVQGYVFSEPHILEKEGGDPHVLMVSSLGFNPYTSVLITTDATLQGRPEIVRAVVQASRSGWERYLQDAEATHRHINQINPEMSLEVLDYGVQALEPLVLTEAARAQGIGTMALERWQQLLSQLEEIGLVEPDRVRAEEAFSTEFLAPGAAHG